MSREYALTPAALEELGTREKQPLVHTTGIEIKKTNNEVSLVVNY